MKPRTAVAIVDAALVAAFLASLLVLVLAMVAPAHAGQMLYNNGAGFRYGPPVPRYYAAPVPRYYPRYLSGYVQPYRPNPAPLIAGAILGAAASVAAVPMPTPRPDAISEIRDSVTRAEVVSALERLCELEPETPICQKMSQQQPR
jgi:hypothetical protein